MKKEARSLISFPSAPESFLFRDFLSGFLLSWEKPIFTSVVFERLLLSFQKTTIHGKCATKIMNDFGNKGRAKNASKEGLSYGVFSPFPV